MVPLPKGINVVVCAPSMDFRNALIGVIDVVGGISPEFRSESESAKRAHYPAAECKVIINTPAPEMYDRLGPHSVVLALEVAGSRVKAAETAAHIFRAYGFSASVVSQAEPEFPDEFIPFVKIDEGNGGILLMFWPPPKEVAQMDPQVRDLLPKRVPWNES